MSQWTTLLSMFDPHRTLLTLYTSETYLEFERKLNISWLTYYILKKVFLFRDRKFLIKITSQEIEPKTVCRCPWSDLLLDFLPVIRYEFQRGGKDREIRQTKFERGSWEKRGPYLIKDPQRNHGVRLTRNLPDVVVGRWVRVYTNLILLMSNPKFRPGDTHLHQYGHEEGTPNVLLSLTLFNLSLQENPSNMVRSLCSTLRWW